jgi:hypothetical protein
MPESNQKRKQFCGFELKKITKSNFLLSSSVNYCIKETSRFRSTTINSFEDVKNIIKHDWSPIVWKQGQRKKDNFQSCELLVLDVDNDGDAIFTIEAAKNYLEQHGLAYIIAPSRSHQKEKGGKVRDRFRIIIPLEEPILAAEAYEEFYVNITEELDGIGVVVDNSCKDGGRFFFASPNVYSECFDGCCLVYRQKKKKKCADKSADKKAGKRLYENSDGGMLTEKVPVGERNSTLFKRACKAYRLGYDKRAWGDGNRLHFDIEDKEFWEAVDNGFAAAEREERKKEEREKQKEEREKQKEEREKQKEERRKIAEEDREEKAKWVKKNQQKKVIKQFMEEHKLDYYRDKLTEKVFLNEKVIDKSKVVLAKIYNLANENNLYFPKNDLDMLLTDHLEENTRDVFGEWIGKEWDGHDYIKEFFSVITIQKRESDDFEIESDIFPEGKYYTFFKRWLIGVAARFHDSHNANHILVLYGGQGIGKTRLVNQIYRGMVSGFHIGSLNPDDKDHKIKTSKNVIWFIDECDNITKKSDIAAMKDLTTSKIVNERPPYGDGERERPNKVSFIGSTNRDCFLTDHTGNRRYRVIPVESIDMSREFTEDFIQKMFNQANHLFLKKEKFFYTTEESAVIDNEDNSNYVLENEVTHIMSYLQEGPDFMSLLEIVRTVFPNGVQNQQRILNDLGSAIIKKGLVKKTLHGKKGFRVNKIQLSNNSFT